MKKKSSKKKHYTAQIGLFASIYVYVHIPILVVL